MKAKMDKEDKERKAALKNLQEKKPDENTWNRKDFAVAIKARRTKKDGPIQCLLQNGRR